MFSIFFECRYISVKALNRNEWVYFPLWKFWILIFIFLKNPFLRDWFEMQPLKCRDGLYFKSILANKIIFSSFLFLFNRQSVCSYFAPFHRYLSVGLFLASVSCQMVAMTSKYKNLSWSNKYWVGNQTASFIF